MTAPLFEQLASEQLLYTEPPTVEIPLVEPPGVEDFQALPAVLPRAQPLYPDWRT